MTERDALRVTLAGLTLDVSPRDVEGFVLLPRDAGTAPAGTGTLRTRDGLRRLHWSAQPLARGFAHEGTTALELVVDGWRFVATIEPLRRAQLRELASRGLAATHGHRAEELRAPIPGRIGSVRVVEGDAVEAGATLLTLEAMKMENIVRSPRPGTIGRVAVRAGQTVELGETLLELL